MKHLISTYVVLLISTEVSAVILSSSLFEPRSLASNDLRQLSIRSTDTRTLSLDRRSPYQIQPRVEHYSSILHRRSGQGRSNNQGSRRHTHQLPFSSREDLPGDPLPRVIVTGHGPVKVTGERDGHKRTLPTTRAGVDFELPAYSHKHTRLTVKAMQDNRTGTTGAAKVLAIGHESARVQVQTQDALGHIARLDPPPHTERFVAPYRHDEEEAKAGENAPQKQVVKAMLNGKGTIVADAKSP